MLNTSLILRMTSLWMKCWLFHYRGRSKKLKNESKVLIPNSCKFNITVVLPPQQPTNEPTQLPAQQAKKKRNKKTGHSILKVTPHGGRCPTSIATKLPRFTVTSSSTTTDNNISTASKAPNTLSTSFGSSTDVSYENKIGNSCKPCNNA